MKVLIADDEPLALKRLEQALACIPEVEMVGAVRSGGDAERLIQQLRPDVAILDIQMPGVDGVTLVERLQPADHIPEIIFLTAFSEYAVRAFDIAAADYITKPFEFERLRAAVRRAKGRLEARSADDRFAQLQKLVAASQDAAKAAHYETEIWVRKATGLHRLALDQVDYVEAQGDYVELHLQAASHTLRDTISSLEQRLDPARFLRCHRSVIVNMERVRGLRRRTGKGFILTLSTGKELVVGPSYVDQVTQSMKIQRSR